MDDLPSELAREARPLDGRVVIETGRPLADLKVLADWALGRGLELPDLDVRRPSLEDVYLELTE